MSPIRAPLRTPPAGLILLCLLAPLPCAGVAWPPSLEGTPAASPEGTAAASPEAGVFPEARTAGLRPDAPAAGPHAEAPAAAAHTRAPAAADTLVEVRLQDGSRFVGRVVEETDEALTLETPGGVRVTLDRNQIETIRTARGRVVDGRFLPEDPNRTRLFFAPTARPLERGQGYISSYFLFFPFVGVGVSDRITLAAGTPILPNAMGELFYVAPKVTVASRPDLDLAVGALAFFATRELDEGSIGLVYGVGTFGGPDQAVTVGSGWGFALGGRSSRIESDPVILLGGEFRAGERVKFVTENWIVPTAGAGIITGGIRFFGDRLAADLGLGAGFDDSTFCCLPMVNFVYNFR